MAFTLEQLRSQFNSAIDQSNTYLTFMDWDADALTPKFGAYMDADAEAYFESMMENLYYSISWAIGYSYQYTLKVLLKWMELAEEELGGAELTMDALINAMLTAEPDEFQKFVGIEDAYRMALWNAPFNVEFYAALARGFKQWA